LTQILSQIVVGFKYEKTFMNIINFTPLPAFIGGIVIGLAVVMFYLGNGRLAGISGIMKNFISSNNNRFDNLLFLIGLILGPLIYSLFSTYEIPFTITTSLPTLIIGGLLVGVGTGISNGCTSGHGICGISRFSPRSILATIIFLLMAIITVVVKGSFF
jgi:uncharacterized membrane protein YedE/YeeE